MKKIGLFWMFFLALLTHAQSQITVTKTIFPKLGDTLFLALDIQPSQSTVITPPGGDQNWDLSYLRPTRTSERIFIDPQTAAGSAAFAAATLYYDAGNNVEAFLRVSDREVSLLGYNGGDPIGLGLNLVSHFKPPIVQSRAPINFFDITQVSSGLLLPFSFGQLPDSIRNLLRLPTLPDSMRIRTAINRLDVVDAWGTLTIPGGEFPVLREKRTQYRENRLDAKFPVLGWLDITDIAIQYLRLSSLGVDTLTTYHFWNNQSKEPIAVCTTDNSQLRVVRVEYKNLEVATGLSDLDPVGVNLDVFPNPAEGYIHIRANDLNPGDCTVVIYNVNGVAIWRRTFPVLGNQLDEEIDIGRFERGAYFCHLSIDGGKQQKTGQVIFVKH